MKNWCLLHFCCQGSHSCISWWRIDKGCWQKHLHSSWPESFGRSWRDGPLKCRAHCLWFGRDWGLETLETGYRSLSGRWNIRMGSNCNFFESLWFGGQLATTRFEFTLFTQLATTLSPRALHSSSWQFCSMLQSTGADLAQHNMQHSCATSSGCFLKCPASLRFVLIQHDTRGDVEVTCLSERFLFFFFHLFPIKWSLVGVARRIHYLYTAT